jgi:4-hydroxy-tetrahydrodipicolinate reductase
MIRLAVLGAGGRMGRRVVACAAEIPGLKVVAAVDAPGSPVLGTDAGVLAGLAPIGVPVVAVGEGCFADADVVIDFSLPAGLKAALAVIGSRALVSGVTGADPDTTAAIDALATRAPVLVTGNFSTGVHVLADLVRRAVTALPDYDVEIVEAHHRRKVDAPSGTAWLLGKAAAEARGLVLADVAKHGRDGIVGARPADEIGFHAVRGGDVVGDHQVWIAGEGERLQLGHVATSRDTFARGALRAAGWIAGRLPGRYAMNDVLDLRQDTPRR